MGVIPHHPILKKSPRCVQHRGLLIYRISLSFYALQLVTPSVVAMAVRKDIAICKIVFQVFAFIIILVF